MRLFARWCLVWGAILVGTGAVIAAEKEPAASHEEAVADSPPVNWLEDYRAATKQAADAKQLLMLWFFDPAKADENEKFAASVLGAEQLRPSLREMTLVKLPVSAAIKTADLETKLLEHAAFSEMLKGPGIAMIDFRDAERKEYGFVVSVYPFRRGAITASRLQVMCDLPAGSLTQRALMFAVRTHPAAPKSAWSPYSGYLTQEAEKHSTHQASINLQGHHNWEARFHQINQGLATRVGGSSFSSKEVCAESWPGQTLLDAAEECVHSWSQSSGHWSAVSAAHGYFGYDMKRGSNGVWYATGIFGGR
ncbi:hypothetical protein ETAA8_70380 [Anatilimnocola aggregata]|uniref:CAP domain-containing protein n=1 Tax=Anatilimnocola aggregata TaxID=2528021 RepID=A0A517YNS8_9BACT|nr:hypothetical protein [Anatilimnocola aggregata]QDU31877.1 hypothetical protein ETAA8_70380 [Anatilimnocola aggregata]